MAKRPGLRVSELLQHRQQTDGAAPALLELESGRAWTWAELAEACRGYPADCAVIEATRRAETVLEILGRLAAGGTVMPVDVRTPQRLALPAEFAISGGGTVIQTSGSSGRPRGVIHQTQRHLASARGMCERISLAAGDRWLLGLPLYHVGGLAVLFRALVSGATVVLAGKPPSLGEIATAGVTHASVVPTQLVRWLAEETEAGVPGRLILIGGAAVPETAWGEGLARGWPVAASYGSTEMASTVTMMPLGQGAVSAGLPLPGREVRITEGEIELKGEMLADGYVGEPLPLVDGWFRTGDLGTLDAAGALTVHGRRDQMLICGGKNVYPEELERAILGLPGVRRACVVARPDAEYGQVPVAFVEGGSNWAAQLCEVLPAYKIPVAWHPWPENQRGRLKPDRQALAALVRR